MVYNVDFAVYPRLRCPLIAEENLVNSVVCIIGLQSLNFGFLHKRYDRIISLTSFETT